MVIVLQSFFFSNYIRLTLIIDESKTCNTNHKCLIASEKAPWHYLLIYKHKKRIRITTFVCSYKKVKNNPGTEIKAKINKICSKK